MCAPAFNDTSHGRIAQVPTEARDKEPSKALVFEPIARTSRRCHVLRRLDASGSYTTVDGATAPYGGSHELTTNVAAPILTCGRGGIPLDASGSPVYVPPRFTCSARERCYRFSLTSVPGGDRLRVSCQRRGAVRPQRPCRSRRPLGCPRVCRQSRARPRLHCRCRS
jgi:hypothetical protein